MADENASFDLLVGAPGATQTLDATTAGFKNVGQSATTAAIAVDRNAESVKRFVLTNEQQAQSWQKANGMVSMFNMEVTKLKNSWEAEQAAAAGATRATEAAATATQNAAKASASAATSSGLHGIQLGRVNQEIGTFIGREAGMNTALTRLIAQIGGAGAGYEKMIAGLVGVAALVWVYDKMTEGATKAAEAQKKATDELVKWYQAKQYGDTGQQVKNIEATSKALIDEQKQLDGLNKQLAAQKNNYNAKTGLLDTAAIASTTTEIRRLTDAMTVQRAAVNAASVDIGKNQQAFAQDLQLELKHQLALTGAVGQSKVQIEILNNTFDDLAKTLQFSRSNTDENTKAFARLNDRVTIAKDLNLVLTETHELVTAATKKSTDAMDKYGDTLRKIPSLDSLKFNPNQAAASTTGALLNGLQGKGDLHAVLDNHAVTEAKDVAAATADWSKNIASSVREAARLAEQFGFVSKSAATIASSLGQALAGAGALHTAFHNLEEASIYKDGQGTAALGLLSAGAPIILSFVNSIQQAAQRAKELADTFSKLRVSAQDFAHPENDNDPYTAVHRQAQALRDQAEALFKEMAKNANQADDAARAYTATLADVNAGEIQRIALLDAERAANNAANNARIAQMVADSNAANAAAAYQEWLAKFQAFSDRNQADVQARLTADAQAEQDRQAAMQIAQNAVTLAQQQLDTSKGIYDKLSAFSQSLLLDTSRTILSPAQQLEEARAQFQAQTASALQGNTDAASSLPQFAQTFLDASRAYNASGAQYVADFQMVQSSLSAVTDQFGAMMTVDQMMLDVQKRQLALLDEIAHPFIRGTSADPNFYNENARDDYGRAPLDPLFQAPYANPIGGGPTPSGGTGGSTLSTSSSGGSSADVVSMLGALVNGGRVSTNAQVDLLTSLADKLDTLILTTKQNNDASIQRARRG